MATISSIISPQPQQPPSDPTANLLSTILPSSLQCTFTCPQCQRSFSKKSKLSRHIDQLHNSLRKFPCQHCSKSFKRKQQLKRHYLSHTHQKNFPCQQCIMKFTYKHHLERHVKLIHRKELYGCEECGMEFAKKRSLAKHVKEHKVGGGEKTKRIRKVKEDKVWACKLCLDTYVKLSAMKKHMKRCHKIQEDNGGSRKLDNNGETEEPFLSDVEPMPQEPQIVAQPTLNPEPTL